jgi:uncharacterized protein YegP (UPF0339 family)
MRGRAGRAQAQAADAADVHGASAAITGGSGTGARVHPVIPDTAGRARNGQVAHVGSGHPHVGALWLDAPKEVILMFELYARKPRFEPFLDAAGNWRWRLIAANGEKVATSGESFYSRSDAVRAARRVKEIACEAYVSEF